jgi:PhnB protein
VGRCFPHRSADLEEAAVASTLNPYLNFRGTAREAMERYRDVFGGELILSTFAEMGGAPEGGDPDGIMHGQLTTPSGFTLMGADVPAPMPFEQGNGISVSLSGDDESELRGYWDKLAEGASITEPLAQAPWGDHFGMLTDRFGISWLVNISAPAA